MPDGEILFDYNYSFNEVDDINNLLNLIDQPILWVPAKLGAVFLAVYMYIRVMRWYRESDYEFVKITKELELGENENGEKSETK